MHLKETWTLIPSDCCGIWEQLEESRCWDGFKLGPTTPNSGRCFERFSGRLLKTTKKNSGFDEHLRNKPARLHPRRRSIGSGTNQGLLCKRRAITASCRDRTVRDRGDRTTRAGDRGCSAVQ